MRRTMSYRKPVPVYIPSPPPSPLSSQTASASRQAEQRPPLPEHWHDVIAQARRNHYDAGVALSVSAKSARTPANSSLHQESGPDIQPDPLAIPHKDNDSNLLPRVASPVHLGSGGRQHRLYRPPTPPRPSEHKHWRCLDQESENSPEAPLNRRSKFLQLAGRGSEDVYVWSIGTADSCSRWKSSISLTSSEWQVAETPADSNAQGNGEPMWWNKFKTLGILIKTRMKEYGHFC
ncbi:hypothetical protein DFH06DRAFT_1162006 [Mycena polygramma]|nr:hypothetical protein DFH06DRAFT_1162006 [Mycena polygramma]